MTEYRCKIKEEMKAMQSEIKQNIQVTNSEGKQTGTQINFLEQKEKINIQPDGAPRQRNMAQMKGQIKTPEKELCDEEIANLSDAKF